VFRYLNDPLIAEGMEIVSNNIRTEMQFIEQATLTQGSERLSSHWNEFYQEYYATVSAFAREYVSARIGEARRRFEQVSPLSNEYRQSILEDLKEIEDQIGEMYYPHEVRRN